MTEYGSICDGSWQVDTGVGLELKYYMPKI